VKNKVRCGWPGHEDELMISYHDTEWGVPLHNDRKLYEFIVLEGAQAGLRWKTVLHKREGYRKAFDQFDPEKVAQYTEKDLARLLADASIIRNRQKILSAINNAKRFLEIQKKFGSFDKYIWQFTDGKVIKNAWKTMQEIPARTELSDTVSKDMIAHGFNFVGTTIMYAHLQATGMVNDHIASCYRYNEV
jgi:DNA-3-methyladenine glycosylase I